MIDLPLFAQRDHDASQRLTGAFMEALSDGGWHLGKQLCKALGTNERVIRECASRSHGKVISTNLGYRLLKYATVEEVGKFEARQLSQIADTKRRLVEVRQELNRLGRSA